MIRNLLAATAVATVIAAGAFAQETTPEPAPAAPADSTTPVPMEQAAPAVAPAEGHLSTNIVGETVYNGTGEDAQNIGDVNNLVIDKDGKVKSIVIGVGGFLGLGAGDQVVAAGHVEGDAVPGALGARAADSQHQADQRNRQSCNVLHGPYSF